MWAYGIHAIVAVDHSDHKHSMYSVPSFGAPFDFALHSTPHCNGKFSKELQCSWAPQPFATIYLCDGKHMAIRLSQVPTLLLIMERVSIDVPFGFCLFVPG